MKFKELNLSNALLRAIEACNYDEATYIQSAGIPLLLEGKDVIGQSQTGTGKTAAFAIPLIETLEAKNEKKPSALILTPTRELALQVTEEIRKFAKYKEGIRVVSIYGGAPIQKQIQEIKKGCNIIVGCPGRVLDHIRRKTLRFDQCTKIILDEADEMLNMGFREDIETILKSLPEERQTVLFSATMPKAILDLTTTYQKDPIHIKTPNKEMTASKIEQIVYECKQHDKYNLLIQLIELRNPKLAIVFCNTKKMVDDLTSDLVSKGYPAAALHGDMKQEARSSVMQRFKAKKINILIATDVAARGIDVDNMDVVYNYDFPQETEYYVHRIGRTGRAGKNGVAITLLTPRQSGLIKDLERITKATIQRKELPTAKEIYETRLSQAFNDIQNMLEAPISEDVQRLVEEIHHQHISYNQLSLALANHLFSKSLIVPVIAPASSSSKKGKKKLTYETVEINLGKKHRMKASTLAKIVTEATGLSAKEIGNIEVKESSSSISLPKHSLSSLNDYFKKNKVQGNNVKVQGVNAANKKSKQKKSGKR
ncbi:MAG: DEAD/DEAH box helicase [Anaerorhabdus sp.]